MSVWYVVELELPGNPLPCELCKCASVESLAQVLCGLARTISPPPLVIRARSEAPPAWPMSVDDVRTLLRLFDAAALSNVDTSPEDIDAVRRIRAGLPPF